MEIYPIVRELIDERNRVDRLISLLEMLAGDGEGASFEPGRRGRKAHGRKSMDEQARRRVSERMKRYGADRRKA
ncbi:MAG: hypothetical protein ABSB15_27155 [Bryobacteraceae bacterium]|jgi:hypothetical protein